MSSHTVWCSKSAGLSPRRVRREGYRKLSIRSERASALLFHPRPCSEAAVWVTQDRDLVTDFRMCAERLLSTGFDPRMEQPAGTIFSAFYQPCQSLFCHSPFTLLALFVLPRQGPLQNTTHLLTHPGCLSWDCYHLRLMSTKSHPGATTSAPRKPILPTPRMGKVGPIHQYGPSLENHASQPAIPGASPTYPCTQGSLASHC